WKRRFSEILDDLLAEPGFAASTAARKLMVARAREQVEAFLAAEAQRDTDMRPRPDLLEVAFGFEDEAEDGGSSAGALQLGDFALRGRIDRIDVGPDGHTALLHDYKTSTRVPGRAALRKDGKLQLQLYALAARDQLGLQPIGALYHPLGARGDGGR